ncbi:hypothetical protein QA612_16350 [Evansella sp. AB-P1]|uniref:putative amidoligase domain-containing protein n=1 Tax=Evansella sp. AB-P1 TaxID=3037653 RepID=UPI00241CDC04|nr:hypothetical protein [Evansella sp. AB-P1]MDG5789030.1 hypothetical protein [Evansella sp. AB-P1]
MNKYPWENHYIRTSVYDEKYFQLFVIGKEYFPIKVKIKEPYRKEIGLSDINDLRKYYLGQEMLDFAMMTAYYCNAVRYNVHVQRKGKEITIVTVKNNSDQTPVNRIRSNGLHTYSKSLLGADLEVMCQKRNGKFVAIPFKEDHDKEIGTDRALIRKGNTFYQPIIELRANPQKTGELLQKEFVRLKGDLEEKVKERNLTIVSTDNPKGRFFLGGHFHISNSFPTYRKTSLLDGLVTLPLVSIKKGNNMLRRKGYGRLGSIRLNKFNGFEYRTLPTWYSLIDEGKPFFNWIETIFFNDTIPPLTFSEKLLTSYYDGDNETLKEEVNRFLRKIVPFLTEEEEKTLLDWIDWLRMMEMKD